jgi:hypothetical protein
VHVRFSTPGLRALNSPRRAQFTSDDVVGCVELGLGRLAKDGPLIDAYEPIARPPNSAVVSRLWRGLVGPPPKAELRLSAAVQTSPLEEGDDGAPATAPGDANDKDKTGLSPGPGLKLDGVVPGPGPEDGEPGAAQDSGRTYSTVHPLSPPPSPSPPPPPAPAPVRQEPGLSLSPTLLPHVPQSSPG